MPFDLNSSFDFSSPDSDLPESSIRALLCDVAIMGDRALVGQPAHRLATLAQAARTQIERLAKEKSISSAAILEAVDIHAVIAIAAERQRLIELLLAEGLDATHLPDGVTAPGAEAITRGLAEALRLSGLPESDVQSINPALAAWIATVKAAGLWGTRPERFASSPWNGRVMGTMEVAQGVMEGRLQQIAAAPDSPSTDAVGPSGLVTMLRTAKKTLS